METERDNDGRRPLERVVRLATELDYAIVAEPFDYYVEYKIYEITGYGEGDAKGVYDKPIYSRIGAKDCGDVAEVLEEAEVYFHGSVKWDGCSNWWFDEQERGVMLHGCSKHDVQKIGDVMALCWDWTAKLCSHWQA